MMQWIVSFMMIVAVKAFAPSVPLQRSGIRRGIISFQMSSTALAPPANVTDAAVLNRVSTTTKKELRVRRRRRSSIDKETSASRKWNARYEALRAFYKQHGLFEADEPKELATWIRNQRTQYRYMHQEEKHHLNFLTEERIEKLESLGFVWNPQDAKWKQMYMLLVDFRDRFGHCDVPTKWKENVKLSQWVSHQRFKYKARQQGRKVGESIKKEQIERLESIGFCWDPKGQVWWSMYRALEEFKREYGHCRVPQVYRSNPKLGIWVRHQRRACRELVLSVAIENKTTDVYVSGLDKERLEALRDIDFCWLPDPKKPGRIPPRDIFDYIE